MHAILVQARSDTASPRPSVPLVPVPLLTPPPCFGTADQDAGLLKPRCDSLHHPAAANRPILSRRPSPSQMGPLRPCMLTQCTPGHIASMSCKICSQAAQVYLFPIGVLPMVRMPMEGAPQHTGPHAINSEWRQAESAPLGWPEPKVRISVQFSNTSVSGARHATQLSSTSLYLFNTCTCAHWLKTFHS